MSTWNNRNITVNAWYIPKFLWTTASIDVFLDQECILRTGGQAKLTGGHSGAFTHEGAQHQVELTWGQSTGDFAFPYRVFIDAQPVDEGIVRVENRHMMFIPAILIVAVVVLIMGFLARHLVSFLNPRQ